MADIEASIRLLCQQLDELRAKAAEPADLAEIEALTAAALAGTDLGERRQALARRLGLSRRRRRVYTEVLGAGAGHSVPDVFVCPAGRCPRTWLNVPGKGDPPVCALDGVPMRRG
ncbi:hypothetical protein ACFWBN_22760 [Streptomyces sp. NPDC059989]|uniref:hypothetical protein n=1 Tax=Streptomyces sp. NPDC059989 TaxID=3347026 RepID=UPI0036A62050